MIKSTFNLNRLRFKKLNKSHLCYKWGFELNRSEPILHYRLFEIPLKHSVCVCAVDSLTLFFLFLRFPPWMSVCVCACAYLNGCVECVLQSQYVSVTRCCFSHRGQSSSSTSSHVSILRKCFYRCQCGCRRLLTRRGQNCLDRLEANATWHLSPFLLLLLLWWCCIAPNKTLPWTKLWCVCVCASATYA